MLKREDIKSISYVGDDSFKVQWQPTRWCNYKCEYCCQSDKNKTLTITRKSNDSFLEEAKQIAEFLHNKVLQKLNPNRTRWLSYIGGEVSFYDLTKASQIIYDRFPFQKLSIITNLSAPINVYSDLINFSIENNIKLNIVGSYHDTQISAEKFIEKAIEIKKLTDSDLFNFTLTTVLNESNYDKIAEFFKLAYNNDFKFKADYERDKYGNINVSNKCKYLLSNYSGVKRRSKQIYVLDKNDNGYSFIDRVELQNALGTAIPAKDFYCNIKSKGIKIDPNGLVEYLNCVPYNDNIPKTLDEFEYITESYLCKKENCSYCNYPDMIKISDSQVKNIGDTIKETKEVLQIMWCSEQVLQDIDKLNYRRFKLSAYLKNRFGKQYESIKDMDSFLKARQYHYKTVIVSIPTNIKKILKDISYEYLIYDRSDNWSAFSGKNKDNEDFILEKADRITYTAKTLFIPKYENKMVYLTNGLTKYDYVKDEKFKNKTAIYIGRTGKKVDWDFLNKLAIKNPTWDILVYSSMDLSEYCHNNIIFKGFLNEKDLFNVIKKCHVGLIPFIETDYTKAMCPLKLFNYANGHIPTLYLNSPECDLYPTIAFDAKSYTLEDLYKMNISAETYETITNRHLWNDIFEKLLTVANYPIIKDIGDKIIKMDDIEKISKTNNTFKISWKMTSWCNYRCSYCYMANAVKNQDNFTPVDLLIKISKKIDDIIEKQAHGRDVVLHLIGGEVSHFNLREILDNIKSPQLKRVIVATNFSRNIIYWTNLKNYCTNRGIVLQIIASLHLEACPSIDNFINKAIKLKANIKCVVTNNNISKYKEYLDTAIKAGLSVQPTIRRNDKNIYEELSKENKEYVNYLNNLQCKTKEPYFIVTMKDGIQYKFITNIQFINSIDKGGLDTEGFICTAGLDGIRIAEDGSLRRAGCRHASISPLGNILDDYELPSDPFVCHTTEADKNGIEKYKLCTCFGNASMWRQNISSNNENMEKVEVLNTSENE